MQWRKQVKMGAALYATYTHCHNQPEGENFITSNTLAGYVGCSKSHARLLLLELVEMGLLVRGEMPYRQTYRAEFSPSRTLATDSMVRDWMRAMHLVRMYERDIPMNTAQRLQYESVDYGMWETFFNKWLSLDSPYRIQKLLEEARKRERE